LFLSNTCLTLPIALMCAFGEMSSITSEVIWIALRTSKTVDVWGEFEDRQREKTGDPRSGTRSISFAVTMLPK
jgi:hypothetical protein